MNLTSITAFSKTELGMFEEWTDKGKLPIIHGKIRRQELHEGKRTIQDIQVRKIKFASFR